MLRGAACRSGVTARRRRWSTARVSRATAKVARGSPRGVQQHAAREFHLVLTALAAGVNYRKFFNGQRSVHVFAGTVGELLGAISVALSEQGISVNGPAELLYADGRHSAGN